MKKGRKKQVLGLIIVLLLLLILSIFIYSTKSTPQIISASVYPEKVMPGQILLIEAEAKDNFMITGIKASIETDAEPDVVKLVLKDGTRRNGIYERGWIVHDTSARKWYNITITATNIFGKTVSVIVPFQDPTQNHPASEITAGTFSAGNYTFPEWLAVNKTLTINSTILLKPESSPANQTGYAKIYYKSNDIDSYAKLLLHMDGTNGSTTFTDSSSGAKSVTANGQAHTDTQYQKFGTASGRFDGSGDYLTTPDHADWTFGTGDFTVDFWVRWSVLPSVVGYYGLLEQWTDNDNRVQFFLYYTGTSYKLAAYSKSGAGELFDFSRTVTIVATTWYHVGYVRSGNTGYIFLDGVQQGTTYDFTGVTFPDLTSDFFIGTMGGPGMANFNGWLDELRISKGIARWTSNSNFNVRTSAYGGDKTITISNGIITGFG